jgi:hypothetical protein
MKRIKIMGLCLVAVFVMSAMASAAASAAEPAWFECKLVAGGKFEKGCKKEGVGKKAGYGFVEGVGKAKPFKGAGGKATLHTHAVNGEVTCTAFKDSGTVDTPKHEKNVLSIFTGCVSVGKKCSSPLAKIGEIKTFKLEGGIGYISAAEHRAGTDLKAEGGGLLAEFACTNKAKGEKALEIKVKGSVIGEITPVNTLSKVSNTVFVVDAEQEQKYKNLEGQPEDILLSEIVGIGTFKSGQEAAAKNTGEELELKA